MALSKRTLGPNVAWAAAVVPVLLAVATSTPLQGGSINAVVWIRLGQFSAIGGMALLSISFVLSSRARVLEDYFGGVDGMYRTHHAMGVTAFVLLCVHPLALALRFVPDEWARAALFLLPVHGRWTVTVGVVAFWALVLLIGLTFASRVPYDTWKRTHQFLGLVLIAGLVHMVGVESTRGLPVLGAESVPLQSYMVGLGGLGVAAWLYKLIIVPRQAHRHRYRVDALHALGGDVMEVELVPNAPDDAIGFFPGQFVWVTFEQDDLTNESHPFTICSPAGETRLRLTIKALGDFTRVLHERLQTGSTVRVDGPYGRFDYRNGGPKQAWIAGGVGIAPFLSWARHLAHTGDGSFDVDVYYCVHSRGDAVYHDELTSIASDRIGLNVVLVCSEDDGHLHATDVEGLDDRDVFLCGPKRLTTDLSQQVRSQGVTRDRIHVEDFEFRES